MNLYYYKDQHGNFGDDLNIWLWSRLLPGIVDTQNVCNPKSERTDFDTLFVGIGSILDGRIPTGPRKIVFSSGSHGSPPPIDDRWDIVCVRGPKTAAALGLDRGVAVTDGAVLVRTIEHCIPERKSLSSHVSYMPHHVSTDMVDWARLTKRAGFNYIDPSADIDWTLSVIRQSELVITEAMHGAIVADALRTPWIPVRFHDHINYFKWQDWCESIGLKYSPEESFFKLGKPKGWVGYVKNKAKEELAIRFLRSLPNRESFLSKSTTLDTLTEELLRRLETIRDI
jgi:succinoglycan biosynthesis protein ExoV